MQIKQMTLLQRPGDAFRLQSATFLTMLHQKIGDDVAPHEGNRRHTTLAAGFGPPTVFIGRPKMRGVISIHNPRKRHGQTDFERQRSPTQAKMLVPICFLTVNPYVKVLRNPLAEAWVVVTTDTTLLGTRPKCEL